MYELKKQLVELCYLYNYQYLTSLTDSATTKILYLQNTKPSFKNKYIFVIQYYGNTSNARLNYIIISDKHANRQTDYSQDKTFHKEMPVDSHR